VPIIEELQPVVDDIIATTGAAEFVLTATRWLDPPFNTRRRKLPEKPMAAKPLWELVRRVGKRAGIPQPVHPHLLRHAFGDYIARHGGLELARAMLGHADVRTTKMYVGDATLDELAIAVHGLRYDRATPAPVEPQVTPVTRTQSVER
jgi:integrase